MTFLHPNSFSVSAIQAAKAHALQEFPKESCGLIIDDVYVPYENVAENPLETFVFPASVYTEDYQRCSAVIHSHPNGNAYPSKSDMEGQIASGKIWGIIKCSSTEAQKPVFWGDFKLEEPLIGRSFIHGVDDCYSLIRAYFWQVRQIQLPDLARDMYWWDNSENLYLQNFASAGFSPIEISAVRDGDCFIGKILSEVPNHGGVVLSSDKGLGLHILEKRLSRRESLGPWKKYIIYWLRYEDPNG